MKRISRRRASLGAMPVVVTRDKDGTLHGFENRCAHRGSLLVLNESGEARDIICVYHNWSYDLAGNLTGVAFRKGLAGKGGMPPQCRPEFIPENVALVRRCHAVVAEERVLLAVVRLQFVRSCVSILECDA